MGISALLDRLVGATHTRKIFNRLPVDQIVGVHPPPGEFEPEECYFQIRLAEMFLKNQRYYWKGYIPMAIANVDFIHDGSLCSIPVCIGNNQLKAIEGPIEDQYVEYMNTNILGPSPYHGGDFAIFIGLFRVQVADLSRQLFNFLETIIKAFDITQLTSYLQIADAVGAGLSGLLEMNQEVQLQMGRRHVFSDRRNDPGRLTPGFLVYINCPEEDLLPGKLWVENNLLFYGDDPSHLEPFKSHDFCLIEVVRRDTRNDYTTMPFHQIYRRAQNEVFKGNANEADRLFLSMIQQIAASPDLTRPHRFDLIQLYAGNFEKQVELYRKSTESIQRTGAASRGPRDALEARDVLKRAARSAAKGELTAPAERALLDIGSHLDEVVADDRPQSDLSDDDLNAQLARLSKISRTREKNPDTIVAALAADMLNPNR
ncbi:MAG: hypothetical protein V2J65_38040 [Desulfobacteraceae bacterium]|jgi:hypothetical protein|nr:hypothetical protein [Desulfobacteraceae bacterium]